MTIGWRNIAEIGQPSMNVERHHQFWFYLAHVCCKTRDVNDPVVFRGPYFLGRVKLIEADVRISKFQLIFGRPMRKEHAGDIKIGHSIEEEKRDQASDDGQRDFTGLTSWLFLEEWVLIILTVEKRKRFFLAV